MASREIKTKLTLDGEQKFKSAMKDSANAIKVLNSEMKVADAQFKATGDAQEHNAEKARILREQIEEQKKAVEAAEQALEAMRAKGVEPNNQAFQRWQTSLNSAKARLIGMQADLSGVESDINGLSDSMADGEAEAENYGGALASINSQVSFETVIRAVDNVRDRISGLAKTIVSAAGSVWGLMRDAGQWADDLSTEAEIYGISTTELQQWRYAADQVNVSVEDIIKARKRITQEMGKALKEGADNPLNELNVGVLDAENNYRDANEVFWDTINALGQVEDVTRRNQLANDLFGKSYDELIPLINAGREGFEKFAEEAPTLDEEGVQSLNDAQSAFKTLDATLTTTKYELLALFADSFRDIANAITDTVNAFREWSKTEEGKAALDGLAQAVENIVTAFGENADFSVLVGKATGLVEKFTEALSWLTNDENIDKVKGGIAAIAAAWGILTVGKVGLQVAQGVSALKGLTGGGAAAGAGAAGSGAVMGAKTGGIWAGASSVASKIGAALSSASVAAPLTGLALGAVGGYFMDKAQVERDFGEANRTLERSAEIIETAQEGSEYVQRMGQMFDDLQPIYEESNIEGAQKGFEYVREHFPEITEALGDLEQYGWDDDWTEVTGLNAIEIESAIGRIMTALSENIINGVENELTSKTGLDKASNGRIFDSLEEFVATLVQNVEDLLTVFDPSNLSLAPIENAWTMDTDLTAEGENAGTSFAAGVESAAPEVELSAEDLAMMARMGITGPLEINSPSKVMFEYGQNVGAGLAEGI